MSTISALRAKEAAVYRRRTNIQRRLTGNDTQPQFLGKADDPFDDRIVLTVSANRTYQFAVNLNGSYRVIC